MTGVSQRRRFAALGHRARQVVLLSTLTGALTGAAVAGFEWITRQQLFDRLHRAPEGVQVAAPLAALLLAGLALHVFGGGAPATADE